MQHNRSTFMSFESLCIIWKLETKYYHASGLLRESFGFFDCLPCADRGANPPIAHVSIQLLPCGDMPNDHRLPPPQIVQHAARISPCGNWCLNGQFSLSSTTHSACLPSTIKKLHASEPFVPTRSPNDVVLASKVDHGMAHIPHSQCQDSTRLCRTCILPVLNDRVHDLLDIV